jgi:hypothetical protein
MEGKETPGTQLGLASYSDESQQGVSPREDIVDYIVDQAEGMKPEEAAVQRGHLAAQFAGEQGFQEHQEHRERRERQDQGHQAL